MQQTAPDADIVYVDNDPLVLVHALLTPADGGALAYLDADLHDPAAIFASPEIDTFDLSRPVAVTMIAILQLIDDDTARIIGEVMTGCLRRRGTVRDGWDWRHLLALSGPPEIDNPEIAPARIARTVAAARRYWSPDRSNAPVCSGRSSIVAVPPRSR